MCFISWCREGDRGELSKGVRRIYFPPLSKPLLRQKWIEIANSTYLKKPRPLVSKDFVCSLHFEEDDYIPDEENYDSRGRKRTKPKLKPGAFPRINLIQNSNEVKKASKRAHQEYKDYYEEINNKEYHVKKAFLQGTQVEVKLDFNNPEAYYEEFHDKQYSDVKKPSKMADELQTTQEEEQIEFNPWSGNNLEQFLYYNCPECEDKCQMPDDFVEHALTYHPKAALFLKQFTYYKSKLKEEAINYQDYYGNDDDTDQNNISNANESLSAFNNSVDEQIIKLEKDHDNTTLNNHEEETLSYKNAANDDTTMMTYEAPIKSEFQIIEDPLDVKNHLSNNEVPVNRQLVTKLGKKKNNNNQEGGTVVLKKKSKIKENRLKKNCKYDDNYDEKNYVDDCIQQPNFCQSCEIQYSNRSEYQTHYFMQHYIPGQWTNAKRGQKKLFSFTCDHCSFTGRLGFMAQHYQEKHPDDTYILTCTECNFQVPVEKRTGKKDSTIGACWNELRKYFYHVKKHKETPDYMCSFCAKTFIRLHGLKRHMKHSHSEDTKKDFVCELCGYKTHLEDFLKKHYIHQHDESKKKQCPHCDYNNTIYQHLLDVHIDNNHPETGKQAFFCSTCKKGFIYPYSAKYCERKHQDRRKSYPSQQYKANKPFTSKVKGDKVICNFCEKSMYKRTYRRHLILDHPSEVTTVECSICGKTCLSDKCLKKHMEFVHGISDKPNYCQKCKRGYIGNHVCTERKVPEEQSCEYCGRIFKSKSTLREHIDSLHLNKKPFKCEDCGKGFPSNHRLSDHIAQQHKPAICNICNKSISNIWELRRHEVYVHKKMTKDTHICDLCPSKQGRNIYVSAETYARHCKNKHSGEISEKN